MILSARYKSYLGIDIDECNCLCQKNIESEYKNVRFMTLKQFDESKQPIKADVVICFEVFERVKYVNDSVLNLL